MTERVVTAARNFAHGRRATFAAIAGLTLLLALPSHHRLTVTPCGEVSPILDLPIRPGERFTLAYRHSVNELPVRDVHTVDSLGRIVLLEERFRALSAGMGHWPGHGRHVMRGTDQAIEGIDRPIGGFRLRVGGREVGHAILFRETPHDLSTRVPGRVVTVEVRTRSTAGRLLDVLRQATYGMSSPAHAGSSIPARPRSARCPGGIP